MIELSTPVLRDCDFVEKIRLSCGSITAASAFPSTYIWRNDLGLKIAKTDGAYTYKCEKLGENTWFSPCGDPAGKAGIISEILKTPGARLLYVTESDREFIEREFAGAFELTPSPEDDEYVYDRTEQLEMKGGRFANVRKQMNRGIRECGFTAEPFTGKVLPFEPAEREQDRSKELFTNFEDAAGEFLSLLDEFGGTGVTVKIDGRPCAVAAGFELSPDTFDICVFKQCEYPVGLSVYARHELIASLPERIKMINCEEDLGIEGLRLMKQLMRPIFMIKMYRASAVRR